jgi:regulator of sigma E protease
MILSILTFLVVLSILVLVHEAGHYFAAKRAGVLVEEFGFGLPPRLIGKKIGETLYSLNLLPFGGFVRLHGENADDEITNPKRAFMNKNKKTRSAIILAGVFMNFILGITSFAITYTFLGIPKNTENVRVVEVSKDSPADLIGIKKDDVVRIVNGQEVKSNDGFISIIEKNKGKEVVIGYERSGVDGMSVARVTPRENPPANEGSLGVLISTSETYFPPIWQRPFYGVYYGMKDAFYWAGIILNGMKSLVTDLSKGSAPNDLAGPVGIYALTTQAAKFGILTLINFLGVLSINLAVLNVLPFPALDGGRLLFIVIERIFGKRVLPKVEATIHTVGIVILITMILAITAHDIQKLVLAGGVTGYINSVLK